MDDLYSLDERLATEAWLSGEEVAAGLALVTLGLPDVAVHPSYCFLARGGTASFAKSFTTL